MTSLIKEEGSLEGKNHKSREKEPAALFTGCYCSKEFKAIVFTIPGI